MSDGRKNPSLPGLQLRSPEHTPEGDPCDRCGLPRAQHRRRTRDRRAYDAARLRKGSRKSRKPKGPPVLIGIDGEGYTDAKGRHLYTFMAASTATETVSTIENRRGLSFEQVADWLLTLPRHAILVGFSLGYDRAKWLQSLPDPVVFAIERPEIRSTVHGPKRVSYTDYLVSLLATRFSVAVHDGETVSKGLRNGRQRRAFKCKTRTVWDLFRFYQCSFVKALTRWDIGTPDERQAIEKMKARRGKFSGIDEREKAYCQAECRLLAKLAESLLSAHAAEGIVLDKFFGPGSTANVVLARMGAEKQKAKIPVEMLEAAECAYFGGRFEVSHVGPVKGRLYGYDIASAYPHAMRMLPCMAHGRFEYEEGPRTYIEQGPACVRYVVKHHKAACPAWGPLPFRLPDGNIVFPVETLGGGWAWNVEVSAAMSLHPGVTPVAAWVWRSRCKCPPPFAAEIERLYARRKELGKNARGLVLKLALNSLYGKSAQRVGGGGKFRCLVRAGIITATTRAMLLRAIAKARNPWNVLELATDSVLSREPLDLDLGVALGEWEHKNWPRGAFLLRPGMRFALDSDDHVAARGLGVSVLRKNREKILRAWAKAPMGDLTVQQPAMFHGARSSVWRVRSEEDPQVWEYRRAEGYGKWTEPTPRLLSYAPGPKRSGILASPVVREGIALAPWRLPESLQSAPYSTPAADAFADLRELEGEQPEWGTLGVV